MKQAIAKRWVEALRSGAYKKGRGSLRTEDDKFCCLGVLCDLKGLRGSLSTVVDKRGKHRYAYNGELDYLPPSVRVWSGISSAEGLLDFGSLAELNDHTNTFTKVANAIEKHWEEL